MNDIKWHSLNTGDEVYNWQYIANNQSNALFLVPKL